MPTTVDIPLGVRKRGIINPGSNLMKYILSLKAIMQSSDGAANGSGPVMLYEVTGHPQGQRFSIRNVRAASQEPVWEIGRHNGNSSTKWTGAFKTPEEALAQLQKDIDAEVEEILQSGGASQAGFQPVAIRGENLSTTVLRDRR